MTILTEFAKTTTFSVFHVLVLMILCQVSCANICPQEYPLITVYLPETKSAESELDGNDKSQRLKKLTVCTHPFLTEQISYIKSEHTGIAENFQVLVEEARFEFPSCELIDQETDLLTYANDPDQFEAAFQFSLADCLTLSDFICYELDDIDQFPYNKFTAKGEDYGAGTILTSFDIIEIEDDDETEEVDETVYHSFGDTTFEASFV